MFDSLHQRWHRFRADPAGTRFQRRYRRRRERARGWLRKSSVLAAGGGLLLAGIALLVLPGPGLLCIAVGAALIAEESQLAARAFDRADLALSRLLQRRRTP